MYNSRNKKLVESKTYVDDAGNPVIASDKGYATIRYAYGTGNKVVRTELLDTEGNLITGNDGYAVITRKYNVKKLLTEQCYFDEKENPVTGPEGYARLESKYEYNQHLNTWQYDPEGNPVGWHRISEYGLSERYTKLMSDSWYDPEGNPMPGPDGYARVEYEYIGATLRKTSYLDEKGNPYYYAKAGYAIKDTTYEDRRLKETRYYGGDGELCAGPEGYARVTYTESWRDHMPVLLSMFYNADGTPYFNKKGICGIEQTTGLRGRIIEERYFIGEGIRGKSTDGYSRFVRVFNMKGKVTSQT